MNQTAELLKEVVRNARTGLEAIGLTMEKVSDQALLRELLREKEQYQAVERQAEAKLIDINEKPDPAGMMAKNGVWMGMQINTLLDRSTAHLADLLVQGSTMGVVEMTQGLGEYPEADEPSQTLARQLIAICNEGVERAKAFLSVDYAR